ncbi:MAG: N-acyl homoserine lactonase family protein [Rudaea sp.]|uniref:N-acyl homoserine lactonase family protein n=1 Tax=unclassified Rudaea TaxID=2627037 RepID=UPI0010F7B588|nr:MULTISPECIES: N-acyl homoserine lactonase family protein [unclassified Rudaea]MBN8884285.1 N-acyl homoserine lactonase family protein [Rudaea sp.]
MSSWKSCLLAASLILFSAFAAAAPPAAKPAAAAPDDDVRLYALDCGHLDFKSLGMFSDTGEYDGRPGRIVAPCYLIRHPAGWMLWDTGLGDRIAQSPQGVDLLDGLVHEQVTVTLVSQLNALGLAPKDIRVIAFSHLHEDHVGNANLFAKTSTWIVNDKELAWAKSDPSPLRVDPALFSGVDSADVKHIDGDIDVFGDGRVIILKAPGHTPGHQVLLLRLKKSGAVLLTGGLYPLRESRGQRRVPAINVSRADTLASMERIEKIAANQKARVVAQGDPADFAALPKFPAYLN